MTISQFYATLYVYLFYLFADVVYIFADDFASFDKIVNLLISWAAARRASSSFKELKSQIIVVRQGDEPTPSLTFDLLQMEDFRNKFNRKPLRRFFPSIKILYLAADQISLMSRF